MMKKTISDLINDECCNYTHNGCLGVHLSGGRFRTEGECWVKKKEACEFFTKCVLPLMPELTDEYIQTTNDTNVGDINHCECGNIIPPNSQKCRKCRKKAKKLQRKAVVL